MASLEQLQQLEADDDDTSTSSSSGESTSDEELVSTDAASDKAALAASGVNREVSSPGPESEVADQARSDSKGLMPKKRLKLTIRRTPTDPLTTGDDDEAASAVEEDGTNSSVSSPTATDDTVAPVVVSSTATEVDDGVLVATAEPVVSAPEPMPSPVKVEAVEVTAEEVTAESDEKNVVKAEPVVSAGPAKPIGPSKNTTAARSSAKPPPPKPMQRASSSNKRTGPTKPIKFPALSSPGMLLNADTKMTPASVFDATMEQAGYTPAARIHRGSSVKRVVGDMFDTDVKLARNVDSLVPEFLLEYPSPAVVSEDDGESRKEKLLTDAPSKLLHMLKDGLKSSLRTSNDDSEPRAKRPRRPVDMMPVSLTMDYPESFVKQQVEYVHEVQEREEKIVQSQMQWLAMEDMDPNSKPIVIPPIPTAPEPPKLAELGNAADFEDTMDDHDHPLYPPSGDFKKFVEHLDPQCFHLSKGRYFGLSSNYVADPHFCGPSAPGLMGNTISAGTSLATAYVGHQSAGSASLASTVYGNNSNASASATSSGAGQKKTKEAAAITGGASSKKSAGSAKSKSSSSSSNHQLKRIMEHGTEEEKEEMRQTILRAGVFASRTGRHGAQPLRVGRGDSQVVVAPDVAKAFAAYAGLKPCDRCKNNKQGAYHCRLRRKHKDLDHDGGNSLAVLLPLFEEPLDDLLKPV